MWRPAGGSSRRWARPSGRPSGEYRAPKGDLAITAPIVFGRLHVLPVVTAFLEAYPEIDIRMALADGTVDLLAEPVDVAVRIGALPDSSLVAIRLGQIRRVVCLSPAYAARRGLPRRPPPTSPGTTASPSRG